MSVLTHRFECSGEYRAFKAGQEAPRCCDCDQFIEDLHEIFCTFDGKTQCKSCFAEYQTHLEAVREERRNAMMGVADLRESRSSRLLRERPVNIHE